MSTAAQGRAGLSRLLPGGGLSRRRQTSGLALVVLGLPVLTAVLIGVRPSLALESVLLLYLLAVVAVAVVGGVVPALLAAVVSFLLANWFLTPPYRTLVVEGTSEVIDLVVFLLVALTVSITVDVGARRRVVAERRLAEQEARARELVEVDRLRSGLLVALGHDLRTPLARAKAAVSSMRLAGDRLTEADRGELLGTTEDSVDRLGVLVTDLLDLSRLQAGALPVDLRPTPLYQVISLALVDHRRTAVRVDVAEDLPLGLLDPVLLERVLSNLVENALRHSPPDRTVTIRAGTDGSRLRVRVIDHGPGVPEQLWDRMFVPFQRLTDTHQDGGLGLGLAIAAGFSTAMGASLTPSRTPGGGLTMTVDLSVAEVGR